MARNIIRMTDVGIDGTVATTFYYGGRHCYGQGATVMDAVEAAIVDAGFSAEYLCDKVAYVFRDYDVIYEI